MQTFCGYEDTLHDLFHKWRTCPAKDRKHYDYQLKTVASEALQAAKAWIGEGGLGRVNEKNLAGLVNRFSGLCRHPVRQQIDDILGRVAQGVWTSFSQDSVCRWNGVSLAKMANGFSKCTRKEASRVLVLLAQGVNRKATSPRAQAGWAGAQFPMTASDKKAEGLPEEKGWNAQSLALMANALCKAEGADVQQALGHMAKAINERKDSLTDEKEWNAYHLSMMANGLSKAEGADAQQALGHMAKAINERKDSLKDWKAQDLAMMANALSKAEGAGVRDDVQQALGHMAKAINERKDSLKDWKAQDLAMVANALSKAEGAGVRDHVQQALGRIAKAINERKDSLTDEKAWTAQALALVANGLSKAEGDDVQQALGNLAKAINERKDGLKGWPARHLSMMANGLSKADGAGARDHVQQQALGHIAKAINERKDSLTDEKEWTALHLSMMANALGYVREKDVRGDAQQALRHMAKAINERKDGLKGWSAQHLSTMANGLWKSSGEDIRTALIQIEKAVSEQNLTKGTGLGAQAPGTMMSSMGQYCAPEFLKKLTCALAKEAEKDPGALVDALCNMSRFWLSGRHLDAADQLLAALRAQGVGLDDQRRRDQMLWTATLLHFAEQQQKAPDPERLRSFKQVYKHYLPRKPRLPGEARKAERPDDLWHILWSADYWKKDDILAATGAMNTRNSGQPDTSRMQKKVFNQLKNALPDHDLQMEVPINDFPVDIMIDGRMCVEVDGPGHFVDVRPEGGAAGEFVRERRTKDQFIDHMLARYGYQVCRISDAHKPERLAGFVSQICSAVDTAPDSPMKSQGPKTVARQDEVDDQGFQPVQRRRRHKKAPAAAVR